MFSHKSSLRNTNKELKIKNNGKKRSMVEVNCVLKQFSLFQVFLLQKEYLQKKNNKMMTNFLVCLPNLLIKDK